MIEFYQRVIHHPEGTEGVEIDKEYREEVPTFAFERFWGENSEEELWLGFPRRTLGGQCLHSSLEGAISKQTEHCLIGRPGV